MPTLERKTMHHRIIIPWKEKILRNQWTIGGVIAKWMPRRPYKPYTNTMIIFIKGEGEEMELLVLGMQGAARRSGEQNRDKGCCVMNVGLPLFWLQGSKNQFQGRVMCLDCGHYSVKPQIIGNLNLNSELLNYNFFLQKWIKYYV